MDEKGVEKVVREVVEKDLGKTLQIKCENYEIDGYKVLACIIEFEHGSFSVNVNVNKYFGQYDVNIKEIMNMMQQNPQIIQYCQSKK